MKKCTHELIVLAMAIQAVACSSGADFKGSSASNANKGSSSKASKPSLPATSNALPTDAQPNAEQPIAVQPIAVQPIAVQPNAVQPNAVQPNAAQPAAPAPGPVVNCDVQNFPINVVLQTNTPSNQWWENTISVSLPVDATAIRLKIIRLSADDNSASLWINNKLILDFDSEPDEMYAHYIDMNYDISNAIRAGDNSIKGRVLDYYGVEATMRIRISGTYKTSQACKIIVK